LTTLEATPLRTMSHTTKRRSSTRPEATDTWDGALPVSCTGASPSFATDGDAHFHVIVQRRALSRRPRRRSMALRQLVNAPVTVTSSLSQSYLINKLTGLGMCPSTNTMPNGKSPLTMDQIQLIADWICARALDN
jgi:hypothetical protein